LPVHVECHDWCADSPRLSACPHGVKSLKRDADGSVHVHLVSIRWVVQIRLVEKEYVLEVVVSSALQLVQESAGISLLVEHWDPLHVGWDAQRGVIPRPGVDPADLTSGVR